MAARDEQPRTSLAVLLRQAEDVRERRQAHTSATLFDLNTKLEQLHADFAASSSQVSSLAADLEMSRQHESELTREVDALKEQLRQARAAAERTLRRAVQDGQRREATLAASVLQASTERDQHRTELVRTRALLASRDSHLAALQSQLRRQRARFDERELQLQQEAFVRAQTPNTSQTPTPASVPATSTSKPRVIKSNAEEPVLRRALDTVPAATAQRSIAFTEEDGDEDGDLASAQQAYISKLLSAGI
jgi:chromosome segregation ATPase